MRRTLFHSLRWRATFWMSLLLLAIAVAIRSLTYFVTQDILIRDIDTQLWTRLGALKAQQRFAPDTLFEPDLRLGGLFLPAVSTASDWRPSIAMRLLMPSEVGPQRSAKPFPWFAGIWQADGTPVKSQRLPPGFSWQPEWPDRAERIWNSAGGSHRLAACAGEGGTLLLVGTPLADLRQAMREVVWFYVWTVTVAFPPLALLMWAILSRMMQPLARVSQTARRIAAGRFDDRIDLTRADSELLDMATALNGMLERLDAVRISQARFNADVAHEILNPLHGILVQTDVSQQRPRTPEELAQTVEACRSLALRIQKLSESLLSLSRAEAAAGGGLDTIDLEPVVDEAVAQVGEIARERGVTILTRGRSAVVSGNADLLHQVFVNLLANAIEYSPSGGTVEIDTLGDAGRWVVRVIDHGTGLQAGEAERVFERFFRADESRVTATGGHGLGLAICRSIMRGHRGDVVYSPTPGGGATFEVRFDAAAPAVA